MRKFKFRYFFHDFFSVKSPSDSGRHVKLDCHGNRVGYYGVYRLEHSRSYRGGGGGYKVDCTATTRNFPNNF